MDRKSLKLEFIIRIGVLLGWFTLLLIGCSQGIAGKVSTPDKSNDPIKLIDLDLQAQLECGPRLPGSVCHTKIQDYIITALKDNSLMVEEQNFEYKSTQGVNIIGKYERNTQTQMPLIIGAHYDTRFTADRDPDPEKRFKPISGANDGASGVALLLDFARRISENQPNFNYPIWLVFFDLEDNGGYQDWEWIIGSKVFAENLQINPRAVIIVDMIGDKDLQLFYELNSTPKIQEEIWMIANQEGYSHIFQPEYRHRIIDDHLPFIERGIPAIDIIDFDYPYWHTSQDTYDKVSPMNIYIVSEVIYKWILSK